MQIVNPYHLVILLFSGLLSLSVADVVKLNENSFYELVGKDKPAFVKFFAPRCGHCVALAPTYQNLAKGFPKNKVLIAEVNTDEQRALAKKYGITGIPTLLWFPAHGDINNPEKYSGGRDIGSLSKYVSDKSGVKGQVKGADQTSCYQLSSSNFDQVINSGRNVLVKFFAPWCGHCQRLAPVYEQLADIFKNDPKCLIAELNCDQNKQTCKSQGIRGYPTIKIFQGSKSYDINGRDLDRLVAQVNKYCHTKRTVSGKLSKSAGLVPELTPVVQQFVKDTGKQKEVIKMIKDNEKSAGNNENFKIYAYYMEKVASSGTEFIPKEVQRLTNLINDNAVDSKKADELTVRRNILVVFADAAGVDVGDLKNEDLVDADEEDEEDKNQEQVSEELKEF